MAETYREALRSVSSLLCSGFEARVLLEQSTSCRYVELFDRLDAEMAPTEHEALGALVARRAAGEPLQHIVGHWPFFNLDLLNDRRALVPRPETEIVVETAISELSRVACCKRARVLDLGTGSGAIALALANELAEVEVIAVDRSLPALELAKENRLRCEKSVIERVHFVAGDWASALLDGAFFDLVVSNPPYLAQFEWPGLEVTVRDYDPIDALVAGDSGIEAITEIVHVGSSRIVRGGSLVCEIAPTQAESAAALAKRSGSLESFVRDDLAGRKRVLVARY